MKRKSISILLTLAIFVSLFAFAPPEAEAAPILSQGPFRVGTSDLYWRIDPTPGDPTRAILTISATPTSVLTATPTAIPNYGSLGDRPWHAFRDSVTTVRLFAISSIGDRAFQDFRNLENVEISTMAPISRIGHYAFLGCSNLREFTFGQGVVPYTFQLTGGIGESAFERCNSLRRIDISATLTSIGANAFVGTSSLETITHSNPQPTNVAGFYLSGGVLMQRNANGNTIRIVKAPVTLTGVGGQYTIPLNSSGASIDREAFAHCPNLTSVIIPAGVNNIGNRAFFGNPQLETAYFLGNPPGTFGTEVFHTAANVVSPDFTIIFLSGSSGWTVPTWPSSYPAGQRYQTRVSTSSVSVDATAYWVEVGRTRTVVARVHPQNTSKQEIEWTSSDPTVAEVYTDTIFGNNTGDPRVTGTIIGRSAGVASITALAPDSGAVTTFLVNVTEPTTPTTGVILTPRSIRLDAPGTTASPSALTPTTNATLTAIVFPADASDQTLTAVSSDTTRVIVSQSTTNPYEFNVVAVAPGRARITVTTAAGQSDYIYVDVDAIPTFVRVTDITGIPSQAAMGSALNLTNLATVHPANATNNVPILWSVVSVSQGVDLPEGPIGQPTAFRIPWGEPGTIVIEASIDRGLSDVDWGFPSNVPYTKRFTISVSGFTSVTGITPGALTTFVGVPLTLTGTVLPQSAANRTIEWAIVDNPSNNAVMTMHPATGAFLDTATSRVLTAQSPGNVWVRATVRNSVFITEPPPPAGQPPQLGSYVQFFEVSIFEYVPYPLTLQAMPGGNAHGVGNGFNRTIHSIGGQNAPNQEYGGGETITLTATANAGYIFAGWSSTNGGTFDNASSSTARFTMPNNMTTVYAYYTFTGQTGQGGGDTITVLPTPVHYFTHGTSYTRNSGAYFAHVTVRDFQNFSHVTLNGRTLTRNQHYTASRSGSNTEITLANGHLDSLSQGQHSLGVHFRDNISVTAEFTIFWPTQVHQTFTDVRTTDWYYSSVSFVSARGWMTSSAGDPNRFRPSEQVTQGEVIVALYRMAGSPSILNQHGQALQGRDAALEWVRSVGIMPTGGEYNLNTPISRQDVAILLARLVSHMRWSYHFIRTGPVWADEWQIDPVARSAVNDLYRAGVINGRTASTFVPLGNSTRAEFATIMHRFTESVGRW